MRNIKQMKDNKKSRFADPGTPASTIEEGKSPSPPSKDSPNHQSRKQFESLKISLSKSNDVHKWQEVQAEGCLPPRRSYACSCVYKGRYSLFWELL